MQPINIDKYQDNVNKPAYKYQDNVNKQHKYEAKCNQIINKTNYL